MMKKYSKLLFLVSILYTQNTVSDDIISFIEELDNKTIILSMESLENQTKLSISGEQIYFDTCLLYTSPSPRDGLLSRMPSSA